MTENEIIKWMRQRLKQSNVKDAAGLASEFLSEHNITNVLDPDFSKAMDAGFKIAGEIAGV